MALEEELMKADANAAKEEEKETKNPDDLTDEQIEQQKTMNLMMPLLSASVSYSMPLALGIYWLLGSLFSVLQQKILKMIVKKDKDILLETYKKYGF